MLKYITIKRQSCHFLVGYVCVCMYVCIYIYIYIYTYIYIHTHTHTHTHTHIYIYTCVCVCGCVRVCAGCMQTLVSIPCDLKIPRPYKPCEVCNRRQCTVITTPPGIAH